VRSTPSSVFAKKCGVTQIYKLKDVIVAGILFAGDFLNLNGATREADGNGLQFIEYAFSSQS